MNHNRLCHQCQFILITTYNASSTANVTKCKTIIVQQRFLNKLKIQLRKLLLKKKNLALACKVSSLAPTTLHPLSIPPSPPHLPTLPPQPHNSRSQSAINHTWRFIRFITGRYYRSVSLQCRDKILEARPSASSGRGNWECAY